MDRALEWAHRAGAAGEVPVGAVVVRDGIEIAHGINRREMDHSPLGHAELAALQSAAQILKSWRLTGCEVFVTLEPCPMCMAALQQARVQRVIYAAKDPKGGALSLKFNLHGHRKLNHRFPVEQHKVKECETLLKRFFSERRRSKAT